MRSRDAATGPLLGAHMSIAGGVHNALLHAARHHCRAVQLFSKSSNQWASKPLTEEVVELWRETRSRHPMLPVVHDSYLINLASPEPALLKRSRQAFLEEVKRCEILEIPYLVFHPGAHMGAGEAAGIARIAQSIDWALDHCGGGSVTLLLETTAGQGSSVGHRFEHLAGIIGESRHPERIGVCVDTCHIFAAGYDIRTPESYTAVFHELDLRVGLDRLRCFHLNDSRKGLGSRVDRHEHIGRGCVGRTAFRLLMADPRFVEIPKILETPKEDEMDRRNLSLLRRYAGAGSGRTASE